MYCCAECFRNAAIRKFILENSSEDNIICAYCGSSNVSAVSLNDMRDYLIECINKAYEYSEDNENNVLYSISEILNETEDVFADDTDCVSLMTDIFTNSISVKSAIESPYSDINAEVFAVRYNDLGIENMDAYHAWESFKFEVMHYNRFFDVTDVEARESYLWQLTKYLKRVEIHSGTMFYRARVFDILPEKLDDLDLCLEMGPPPSAKSGNNRMSPAGISYLYLSEQKETAIKECTVGLQNVLIARYVSKKNMCVIDLSEDWRVDRLSIFDSAYDHNDYWVKQFISKFVSEISKPVNKNKEDNSYEYALTQMLAEYLRMQKCDGICYSSSQGEGRNFVFFYGPMDQEIPVSYDDTCVRTLPCFSDCFDIDKIDKDELYDSVNYKLADWIFYRSYNDYTVIYNTKDKEISFYNSTVKYILDEFSKQKYVSVYDVTRTLIDKFNFDGDNSGTSNALISFISTLSGNKILLRKSVLIDNPNTLEVQYKKAIVSDDQLISVQFEVSFRCQERCRYCYCVTDKPDREELTTNEIKKLIDDLVEMNALDITFTGGDPFVRSDIHELLQYAYDKGMIISIYTNGTALKDEDIIFLKSLYIREINFTIFSHVPEKHDYFTQLKGSYSKTINSIKKCILVGIPVNIKTPAMNYNKDDIDNVILLAEELGVSIQVGLSISPKNNGDSDPIQYRLDSIEDYVDIMKRLNDHFVYKCSDDLFDIRNNDPDIICRTGTHSVNINPYGDVFPCNPLLIKCGNIREQSINDIWNNSGELKRIRNFKFTDVKGCQECEKQRWCTFCPGTALTETGDPLQKYEEACMITEADTIMGKGGKNQDEEDN